MSSEPNSRIPNMWINEGVCLGCGKKYFYASFGAPGPADVCAICRNKQL